MTAVDMVPPCRAGRTGRSIVPGTEDTPVRAAGYGRTVPPANVPDATETAGAPRDGYKDMDRWLGDGGMPVLAVLGASLDAYGVDGEDLGWADGSFTPTELACNPHGIVQAGIHGVLLDAAMNFAINAALRGKDRTRGTLEMKIETMRPALLGSSYALRGEVTRMAKQVAFAEAAVRDDAGVLLSRATGTFLLLRAEA
jgi:uncharacterized protein (TIGR00369 family)